MFGRVIQYQSAGDSCAAVGMIGVTKVKFRVLCFECVLEAVACMVWQIISWGVFRLQGCKNGVRQHTFFMLSKAAAYLGKLFNE